MERNDGLQLDAVVERFNASEQVLADLREKLRGIVLAEEGAEHAASSLDRSAQRLDSTVAQLGAVIDEIRSTQETTRAALTSAAHFLNATDLSGMRQEVARLAETTDARIGRLEQNVNDGFTALVRGFEKQIAGLMQQVGDVDAARAAQRDAEGKLAALGGSLSDRAKRKAGLA